MASNINTTTINTTYPVAGKDNDSQGFRDNFANTNSNFIEAKTEIEDVQNKGIFKSALIGVGSLANDMGGAIISAVKLDDTRETVVAHIATENPLNLGIKAGSYHTITQTHLLPWHLVMALVLIGQQLATTVKYG